MGTTTNNIQEAREQHRLFALQRQATRLAKAVKDFAIGSIQSSIQSRKTGPPSCCALP